MRLRTLLFQCACAYIPNREKTIPLWYTYLPIDLLVYFSGLSCEALGQGYVSYGLGADISLSLCLSERPGVWKLCTLTLKATAGSKFRGASLRYSALTTRPEVPSPDTPFTQDTRMRTFIYFMPCVGRKSKNQSRSQSPRVFWSAPRHRVGTRLSKNKLAM